jgi:ATP-dependent DNA helicase DinG
LGLIQSAYPRQQPYANPIKALRTTIKEFLCSDHPIVHLPTDGKHAYPALCTLPVNINQLYKQHVWNKSLPIILTSGTLSIHDEFDYAKKTLGLESLPINKVTTTRQPSPFDYRNHCMLYISEKTVFPNKKNPLYIELLSKEIVRLVSATNGRTLILFTSYSVLNEVYSQLKDQVSYPLIVSERGKRNAIDLFKQTTNGVLLSTDAWEGVDIEGDLLSSLIITKLPFPIPSAVHQLTHGQALADKQASIITPTMLVKLKQGFGRLIRTESDIGVCSILDSRANTRGKYREAVLSTLPTCRMVKNIDSIASFIHARDRHYKELLNYSGRYDQPTFCNTVSVSTNSQPLCGVTEVSE